MPFMVIFKQHEDRKAKRGPVSAVFGKQALPTSVGWDCRGGTSCCLGRWHSIKIAHLYVSPPDEFECVQTTRLP